MPTRSSTRAAQGSGTIRQRKDGLWEARYTVGRDPGTGKQVQRSIYGKSEKEFLQKLQKVQVSITSGTYIEPERMTVGDWLDIWLDGYTANLKDATERSYRDNVRLHIKPGLGAVPLQKLKAHTVQGFYNDLSKSGRILQKGQKKAAPAGLSAKSVRINHAILHKALNQAVLLGYIPANPTTACVLPRQTKKEMQILPEGDLPAFLKAVEGHKHRALFLTLYAPRRGAGAVLERRRLSKGYYHHSSTNTAAQNRRRTASPCTLEE